jgi:hypothetical protein
MLTPFYLGFIKYFILHSRKQRSAESRDRKTQAFSINFIPCLLPTELFSHTAIGEYICPIYGRQAT